MLIQKGFISSQLGALISVSLRDYHPDQQACFTFNWQISCTYYKLKLWLAPMLKGFTSSCCFLYYWLLFNRYQFSLLSYATAALTQFRNWPFWKYKSCLLGLLYLFQVDADFDLAADHRITRVQEIKVVGEIPLSAATSIRLSFFRQRKKLYKTNLAPYVHPCCETFILT